MSEPLPPELADLIAAERAAPGADIAARSSVRTAIAAKVGAAPLGASASGLGALGKTLAILAVTVGAGTAAVVYRGTSGTDAHVAATRAGDATEVHAPAPAVSVDVPAPPHAPAPPRAPALSNASAGEPIDERTNRSPSAGPVVAARPVARVQAAASAQPPPSEAAASERHAVALTASTRDANEPGPSEPRASEPPAMAPPQADLLRRATAALAAGDATTALDLARRDRELHPDGVLAEERDALEIRALAKLGRDADARAAATQFFTHYPASVHRAVVERAVRPQPRTHGEP